MLSVMAQHGMGKDGLVCELSSPIEIVSLNTKDAQSEIYLCIWFLMTVK
jgi:hypothetical protein